MELYFLRHADAEPPAPGRSDADRRLSQKGVSQARAVGDLLARLHPEFAAILSSALIRARQTAEIAASSMGAGPVQEASWLAPGCTLGATQDALSGFPANQCLLLVGHEPDFSTIVGQLIGGGRVDVKKAGLACVEADIIEPGGGVLRWLITADLVSASLA